MKIAYDHLKQEKQRADAAEKEAALARERAQKLAEKLRQMGIDPNL